MKALLLAVGVLLSVAFVRTSAAQYAPYYGTPYPYIAPSYPPGPYAYPIYPYYPYPLPLAPSLGFGRGGIYSHVFIPRDEGVVGFTLPGGR
jgi:hypothetical protein